MRTAKLLHVAFFSAPPIRNPSSLALYSTSTIPSVKVHNALPQGCMNYAKSWAWQQVLLRRRLAQQRLQAGDDLETQNNLLGDAVLLLEHSPVYTLGRGAEERHLSFLTEGEADAEARQKLSRKSRGPGTARLIGDKTTEELSLSLPFSEAVDKLAELASPVIAPNGVPIYRVDRGGEVTFHGPSQLVVYPLLDLRSPPFQQDLHWYLRMVEEVVVQTLEHYGIEGDRDEDNTGVWVGPEKVAAVGVSSSRWITSHGFALNVDPDLNYFDTSVIVPCGIADKGVTSMAKILRKRGEPIPSLTEVADVVLDKMETVFGVTVEIDD
eukprot:Nitzschia sp. Nitz4//scaffold35_size145790//107260//108231//NITZ4_003044-RA/size145790-processed-gene-0.242-mRNA-1//-1//CDS//3329549166//3152//frame0